MKLVFQIYISYGRFCFVTRSPSCPVWLDDTSFVIVSDIMERAACALVNQKCPTVWRSFPRPRLRLAMQWVCFCGVTK